MGTQAQPHSRNGGLVNTSQRCDPKLEELLLKQVNGFYVGCCLGVQILDLPDNLHLMVKGFSFAVLAIYGTIVFQIAANGCLEYQEGMLVLLQVKFAFRIQLCFRGGSTGVRHQNFKP